MRKITFTIMLLLGFHLMGVAQQRPLHSLYMFDPLLINPAYAGNHVQLSATAIYRNQWVNFPGAPRTFSTTLHSGFRNSRAGVGIIFGNDQIGVHSDNALYLAYSYRVPVSKYRKAYLSMGVQGGFNNLKSNYTLTNPRETDGWYRSISNFNPNFGGGVYYRDEKMYAGISVPYILNNKLVDEIDLPSQAQQYRYYYLTLGFTHKLSEKVKFLPSALVRVHEQAPLSFDFTGLLVLYDIVGLGASYRLGDSFVGMFELALNENFHVGYAYDITTSELSQYSNGSHELMINYRIKINRIHKGLECPSYF